MKRTLIQKKITFKLLFSQYFEYILIQCCLNNSLTISKKYFDIVVEDIYPH